MASAIFRLLDQDDVTDRLAYETFRKLISNVFAELTTSDRLYYSVTTTDIKCRINTMRHR